MQDHVIEEMSVVEADHWWYRGLRDMIERTLRQHLDTRSGLKVLDAGCGTGQNLCLLRDLLSPTYLGGFDISPKAVELSRWKVGAGADIYQADVCDPELHSQDLDLIVSCDVVSIPGIRQSIPGLTKLAAALRSGGLFILHLAAFRWLYSSHDVITSASDRVTRGEVNQLLCGLGLSVELLSYRVFTFFPGIVAARLGSMVRRPGIEAARTDLDRTPAWLNAPLARVLYAENYAVALGLRLPWGSSVYAVARKK
jgi:SAM-dependent methyltransferase